MKQTERVVAVDFARIVSMLSVILLHATSGYIFISSKLSLGGIPLGYMINQGVRYCVPLFFVLSGLSLELSFRAESVATYLSNRGKKIVLPYLLWTVVYYLQQMDHFVLHDLLQTIFLGTAAPHLYFIVALVQLYIVYIPLRHWIQSNSYMVLVTAFFISFFCQWAVYLMVFKTYILPIAVRPYILKTWMPWVFYFVLGMFLAKKWSIWAKFARKYSMLWIVLSVLFVGFYIIDSHVTNSYDLSVKPVLFIYVPLIFLCLCGIGEWVSNRQGLSSVVLFLSKHSMTVFFSHVLILNYLRERYHLTGNVGMILLCTLVIVLSILFSLVYDWVFNRIKRRRLPL